MTHRRADDAAHQHVARRVATHLRTCPEVSLSCRKTSDRVRCVRIAGESLAPDSLVFDRFWLVDAIARRFPRNFFHSVPMPSMQPNMLAAKPVKGLGSPASARIAVH
jgi:hypothetical protein